VELPTLRLKTYTHAKVCLATLAVFLFSSQGLNAQDKPAPLGFELKFTEAVSTSPITARVYVMLGDAIGIGEPRRGPDWFQPRPFFSIEAKDWKPGDTLNLDGKAAGFPTSLDQIKPGAYRAQAVIRLNLDQNSVGGDGNAYSTVQAVTLDPKKGGSFALTINTIAKSKPFPETDRMKLVELPSPLLSAFYKRPVKHRAGVFLPEGDHSVKRPALYIIPGFGGDADMIRMISRNGRFGFGKEMIRVVLDPDCYTGHHVFADSATNGPRGEALIKEFIPYLEKTFNAIPEPGARLLNGHSSGGWSSLWLQVTYPDFFGGTWSTSPDPVDFRDNQQIDLYDGKANFYKLTEGTPRPVARMGTKAMVFVEPFSQMEDVLGDGGQLSSFEAVFSPLDKAGRPRKLWDRKTGVIDPVTAKAWEQYDIRLILERNWATLGPKLKGKIHVTMGDLDTFYLEGATILLKQSLEKLGSDASITLVPGKDHSSVLTTALADQIELEMTAAVKAYLPAPKTEK
jgi:S-formylglutathione hydrolase FrmB